MYDSMGFAYLVIFLQLLSTINCSLFNECDKTEQQHIIYILNDDLGRSDVGFYGNNDSRTPNMDILAYTGRPFTQYYAMPICTPSRAAAMSGIYPHKIGMQNVVIGACEPYGMPLNLKTLPQALNDLGYNSHMVGKWHLGYYKSDFLPESRGFESFFGHYNGAQDQFDHFSIESFDNFALTPERISIIEPNITFKGLDLNRNGVPQWDLHGEYSTRLFTNEAVKKIKEHDCNKPLFLYVSYNAIHCGNSYDQMPVPEETLQMFSYISDINERRKIAMLYELDKGIGSIMKALKERNMITNTDMYIFSDNGAPSLGAPDKNFGSNWPLKGNKYSNFEGGTKTMGLFWRHDLKNPGAAYTSMYSITDMLPTIVESAGGDVSSLFQNLDGISQYKSIIENSKGDRTKLVYYMDKNSVAVRDGNYKLIEKSYFGGLLDGYSGKSLLSSQSTYNFTALLTSESYLAITSVKGPLLNVTPMTVEEMKKQLIIRCPGDTLRNEQRLSSCVSNMPCLIDLSKDPCEAINLALLYPDIVIKLKLFSLQEQSKSIPSRRRPSEPSCDPKYRNYTYLPYADNLEQYANDQ